MDDFLREIGITQKGNISDDGCYVIDFDDYDDWVKAQSRLERSTNFGLSENVINLSLKSA